MDLNQNMNTKTYRSYLAIHYLADFILKHTFAPAFVFSLCFGYETSKAIDIYFNDADDPIITLFV